MCFVPIRYYTKISYITVIGALNVSLVNVIKFSPSDQQVLRFSLKSVQFDFDDGNSISGLGIELLIVYYIIFVFTHLVLTKKEKKYQYSVQK